MSCGLSLALLVSMEYYYSAVLSKALWLPAELLENREGSITSLQNGRKQIKLYCQAPEVSRPRVAMVGRARLHHLVVAGTELLSEEYGIFFHYNLKKT